MVSGGVAAIYYGEPRLTNDIDIIVAIGRQDIDALTRAFPQTDFYCPPIEVILEETQRAHAGHFNLIHHETGFKADIYPCGQDALHAWGFAHAVLVQLEGDSLWLAPPEYVMVRKLQFYHDGASVKHLRDVKRMLISLGDAWDQTTLQVMIREHDLLSEWQEVLRFDT